MKKNRLQKSAALSESDQAEQHLQVQPLPQEELLPQEEELQIQPLPQEEPLPQGEELQVQPLPQEEPLPQGQDEEPLPEGQDEEPLPQANQDKNKQGETQDKVGKKHKHRFWPFSSIFPDEETELSPVQLEYQSRNRALAKENKKQGRHVRLSFWLRRFWSKSLHTAFHRHILVLSLTIFALASFILLPHFYVNHVTVEGLQSITTTELLEASGLQPGQHMISGLGGTLESYLRFRYHKAEERLKAKFPYIEEVIIHPSFPYGLHIKVQERVGVAYIKQERMVVIVDREGVVLDIKEGPIEGLPLIEGVHDSFVEVGKPLNLSLKQSITSTVLILSTIIDTDILADDHWNFFGRIQSILPVDVDSHFLKIKLPSSKILTVKLGSVAEMKDNLYWLRSILKSGELDQLAEGLLDISGKHRIYIPAEHFKTHIIGGRPSDGALKQEDVKKEKESTEKESTEKGTTEKGGTEKAATDNDAKESDDKKTAETASTKEKPENHGRDDKQEQKPLETTTTPEPTTKPKPKSKPKIEIDFPDFEKPKPFTNQNADSLLP